VPSDHLLTILPSFPGAVMDLEYARGPDLLTVAAGKVVSFLHPTTLELTKVSQMTWCGIHQW
jgi:hypothetical protein